MGEDDACERLLDSLAAWGIEPTLEVMDEMAALLWAERQGLL